jgi:hypothetical protein
VAMGYSAQIKQLNKKFSEIQSSGIKIVISIYHRGTKAGRIKKPFAKFLYKIIEDDNIETDRYETKIKDVVCRATKYKTESGKVEIAALISPNDKSGKKKINPFEFHIPSRLASIIDERVKVKEIKCKNINGSKWLALYDNYINKFTDMNDTEHTDTYKKAMILIEDSVEFEKIFVVFENAQVFELK